MSEVFQEKNPFLKQENQEKDTHTHTHTGDTFCAFGQQMLAPALSSHKQINVCYLCVASFIPE